MDRPGRRVSMNVTGRARLRGCLLACAEKGSFGGGGTRAIRYLRRRQVVENTVRGCLAGGVPRSCIRSAASDLRPPTSPASGTSDALAMALSLPAPVSRACVPPRWPGRIREPYSAVKVHDCCFGFPRAGGTQVLRATSLTKTVGGVQGRGGCGACVRTSSQPIGMAP